MERFYKICCSVMGVVTLIALIVTLVVGTTGVSPTAGRFGFFVVIGCLAVMAILTVLGTFLIGSGGNIAHKIGFYAMHLGAVLLIVGFIVTEFATVTNERTYADPTGGETTVQGDLLRVGSDYDSLTVGQRQFVPFGSWFSLESVKFDRYEDGTPKYYEATIVMKDKNSGLVTEEKVLTVNHPQYVGEYKIYLMNVTPALDGAVLLIKYNPGEYPVLIGIAALVFGAFLSCFTGLRRRVGDKDGKETGEKRKRPAVPASRRERKGGDAQ